MTTTAIDLETLNAQQQRAVTAEPGATVVLAGPGSGKTRVLTTRVAWLIAEQGADPSSILAVTFTNKAAREMRERLARMIDPVDAACVTMRTFHSFCALVLRQHGHRVGLRHGWTIYDSQDATGAMKRALLPLTLALKEEEQDRKKADTRTAEQVWADDQSRTPRQEMEARLVTVGREMVQNNVEIPTPGYLLNCIEQLKRQRISARVFLDSEGGQRDPLLAYAYYLYQAVLREANACDFTDLLLKTGWLLGRYPDVLETYHARYRHILVDEYQDVSPLQVTLLNHLARGTDDIFVVGDAQQSIYQFRGSTPQAFRQFLDRHPQAQIIRLEQNYRSTPEIIAMASRLMSGHDDGLGMELWTTNEQGPAPAFIYRETEEDQAVCVAEMIREHLNVGWQLSDFAILYRTRRQSYSLERALRAADIPFQVVGARPFAEREEVRDVLAYLRLLDNPADEMSLTRILRATRLPPAGIGDKGVANLRTWASEQGMTLLEALEHVAAGTAGVKVQKKAVAAIQTFLGWLAELRDTFPLSARLSLLLEHITLWERFTDRYDPEEATQRWGNIEQLHIIARRYDDLAPEEQMTALLEELALTAEVEGDDGDQQVPERVQLSTLHSAKGLEFPVTFLVGLVADIIPHARSTEPDELAEERRLLFVGITRAMHLLYLLAYAEQPGSGGLPTTVKPSPFLVDCGISLEPKGRRRRDI
jgi:DNA helicase-2/ATP-dependent DNA helicase PcrA